MKKDLVASHLLSANLRDSLKSKNEISQKESEKLRQVKQERIMSKLKLESILNEISL